MTWSRSTDDRVAICFAVEKTTFATNEAIHVLCAVKNLTDKPLTLLRPFGDIFYAQEAGISIVGPDGAIRYAGPMKSYVLGTIAFVELAPHAVIEEKLELRKDIFPNLGKLGMYVIGYSYNSPQYPKQQQPDNLWQGSIKANSVTILIK